MNTKQWYSDGYRAGAPGTSRCHADSDCDPNSICQSGFCTRIKPSYGIFQLFYGNQFANLLNHPNIPFSMPFSDPTQTYDNHDDPYRDKRVISYTFHQPF